MDKKDLLYTLDYDNGDRITSAYAEIYHDDDHCDYELPPASESKHEAICDGEATSDEWISPSDLLIGKVDIKPPFTSKITRGQTHEGILKIGDDVLDTERKKFLSHITYLLKENDLTWQYVQDYEQAQVIEKVKEIYHGVFINKSKIMQNEIAIFYESSLRELEESIKNELQLVLMNAHTSMVHDLNKEIKEKLMKERKILEKVLKDRYNSEVKKIKLYYELLYKNELYRNNKLINKALYERNDALKAYSRQTDTENITSNMYVMCTERRKCKIRQFMLSNCLTSDEKEFIQKLKEKEIILESYKEKAVPMQKINKNWEEKINKILKMFLRFISFCLKLLPAQTAFLLDLEKLVVLQLNELQKAQHSIRAPLLVEDEVLKNIFLFEEPKATREVCEKEPFVIEGDMSESTPTRYDSRETLPSHVDLPYIRVQRQLVYAKCHKYEEVKDFLEAQRCKCTDSLAKAPSETDNIDVQKKSMAELLLEEVPSVSESEPERMPAVGMNQLYHCPAAACQDWTHKNMFPFLPAYLDFNEENFARVKAVLGKTPEREMPPKLINAKRIGHRDLLFIATTETHHNIATQYSSQEDLEGDTMTYVMGAKIKCKCPETSDKADGTSTSQSSASTNHMITQRSKSIRKVFHETPKLMELFINEGYDFHM